MNKELTFDEMCRLAERVEVWGDGFMHKSNQPDPINADYGGSFDEIYLLIGAHSICTFYNGIEIGNIAISQEHPDYQRLQELRSRIYGGFEKQTPKFVGSFRREGVNLARKLIRQA